MDIFPTTIYKDMLLFSLIKLQSCTAKKIDIKSSFLPLCPEHGWKIKLNTKLNSVITAMWWHTEEFKWGSIANAALNIKAKREKYI